jgi:hypothetical protein
MDMDDDRETAEVLFMLSNEIVDEAIARDRRIDEVYENLPEGALEGIENRDGESDSQNSQTPLPPAILRAVSLPPR